MEPLNGGRISARYSGGTKTRRARLIKRQQRVYAMIDVSPLTGPERFIRGRRLR